MSAERITLKLSAAVHAHDWIGRYSGDDVDEDWPRVIAHTARSVTFSLTEIALSDLISDATYYAEEMGPVATGDHDYRPAARACLRSLERSGVEWKARGFRVTVTAFPA